MTTGAAVEAVGAGAAGQRVAVGAVSLPIQPGTSAIRPQHHLEIRVQSGGGADVGVKGDAAATKRASVMIWPIH